MNSATDDLTAGRRRLGLSIAALLAGGGTLVCCVLPAVLVAFGAGAALASLVSAVPALIWMSVHKAAVFGAAGALLAASGAMLWRARGAPCPADPALARHCARLRRASVVLWLVALTCVAIGALFAFALPLLA